MTVNREDRITAAGIQGVAEGWAAGINDRGRHFDQFVIDLEAGNGAALSAALAEIVERLPDDPERRQQILDESAARFTLGHSPHHGRALALLVKAGADAEQATRIQAARGRGWHTPQAEAWQPDS